MKPVQKKAQTTTSYNDTSYLKFADIVDSAKKLKACPIHEIRVGYGFYDELLESVNSLVPPKKVKSPKLYLASLYGVKIIIDPELKKDEYKIVQPNPYEN